MAFPQMPAQQMPARQTQLPPAREPDRTHDATGQQTEYLRPQTLEPTTQEIQLPRPTNEQRPHPTLGGGWPADTVEFGVVEALVEPTVAHQTLVPVRNTVAPPPPPEQILVLPINGEPSLKYGPRPESYQKRGSVIFAAIAACLAAIIAVVALVFVLANRGDNGKSDNTPVLAGAPPTAVKLDDQGTRIALTWADPAEGKTTFLVTGGHPGELLKPMGQTGPGATEYALNGLNVKLDYCFAIVAVYSTSQFATSPQVCTGRAAPKATQ
jgi:hypothetical protein